MRTDVCQRWELGRASYRPAREVIATTHLDVAQLDETAAKRFVEAHHYSKSYPAARFRFGLFDRGELAGVAVFSSPFRPEVITVAFPTFQQPTDGVELGRFVLLDRVAANAETWFLARCFEQLGVAGVISFADPCPRSTVGGARIFPGHIGTIYQAKGARYLGTTEARTIRLLPDGTVFSNFASGKIRRALTGWRSAAAELERFGAPPLEPLFTDRNARIGWLETWRTALTRPMRHTGNHRYAWLLDRSRRRDISYGPERAYPKRAA